jgi:hypothetical protein
MLDPGDSIRSCGARHCGLNRTRATATHSMLRREINRRVPKAFVRLAVSTRSSNGGCASCWSALHLAATGASSSSTSRARAVLGRMNLDITIPSAPDKYAGLSFDSLGVLAKLKPGSVLWDPNSAVREYREPMLIGSCCVWKTDQRKKRMMLKSYVT